MKAREREKKRCECEKRNTAYLQVCACVSEQANVCVQVFGECAFVYIKNTIVKRIPAVISLETK